MAGKKQFKFKQVDYDNVFKFGSRGVREEDMAFFFDMSPRTFYRYCKYDPRILAEYKKGQMTANAVVAESLFRLATEKENVVAQIFWLKCRARWKENNEIKLTFTQNSYGHNDLSKLSENEFDNLFQKAMETLDEPRKALPGNVRSHKKEPRTSPKPM